MSSQFLAPHYLAQWDVNHDGGNVDRLDVWSQSECVKLLQENQAYAGNDHHDEDVGRIQGV
jgi:hypothetical protein